MARRGYSKAFTVLAAMAAAFVAAMMAYGSASAQLPPPPEPLTVTLSPETATKLTGTSHTVTAHVTDDGGASVDNATVTFIVQDGPDEGETQPLTPTNSSGDASFTFTNADGSSGTDTIKAYASVCVSTSCQNTTVADAAGEDTATVTFGSTDPNPNPPAGSPIVVSTTPANNATNVDRDTNITAIFSEKMDPSSISNSTFSVYEANGNLGNPSPPLLDPQVSYSDNPQYIVKKGKKKKGKKRKNSVILVGTTSTATLDPSTSFSLDPNTKYRVVIEGAGDQNSAQAQDLAGNPLPHDYVFTFTNGAN